MACFGGDGYIYEAVVRPLGMPGCSPASAAQGGCPRCSTGPSPSVQFWDGNKYLRLGTMTGICDPLVLLTKDIVDDILAAVRTPFRPAACVCTCAAKKRG